GEVDVGNVARGQLFNTDSAQAVLAFVEYQVTGKQLHVVDLHILTVRDLLLPLFLLGRADRGGHQAKILGLVVGQNIEGVVVVFHIIAHTRLARVNQRRLVAT